MHASQGTVPHSSPLGLFVFALTYKRQGPLSAFCFLLKVCRRFVQLKTAAATLCLPAEKLFTYLRRPTNGEESPGCMYVVRRTVT